MAYKTLSNIVELLFIAPKKLFKSFIESCRTSKIVAFLQVINLTLILYLIIFVIPRIICDYDKLVSWLKTLESPYIMILLISIYFIFWIFSKAEMGLSMLFQLDVKVSILLSIVLISIVVLDHFSYQTIKKFLKGILSIKTPEYVE